MKNIRLPFYGLFICMIFLTAPFGCGGGHTSEARLAPPGLTSYRDVPGVGDDEAAAVERLLGTRDRFTYGMPLSTEAFINADNETDGFSALFCQWLSGLFDIPFILERCEFADLIPALERGELDFSGHLVATEERKKDYIMTEPIAQRYLQYFRLADSPPLSEAGRLRPLRLAMVEGSATVGLVASALEPGSYEPVFIKYNVEAYDLLRSGEIDAFIHQNITEVVFYGYYDIVAEDFYPISMNPVSMSARNPELAPLVSVVQKALDSAGPGFLSALYDEGYEEYRKYKLFSMLSEEEKAYLRDHDTIGIAAEYLNYPISFYNGHDKQWQGVYFDLLREVGYLTGLRFEIVHDEHTEWRDLLRLLEDGEASVIDTLIRSKDREDRFLWPETSIAQCKYVLISRTDHPEVGLADIVDLKIGVSRTSIYNEQIRRWFPGHRHILEFDSTDEAIEALNGGGVDMVMADDHKLLALTHYYENYNYKINYIFQNQAQDTKLGFNINEAVLCSIFDKSLALIEVDGILQHWVAKTYDYGAKLARAQRPWLIGIAALAFCTVALLCVLFLRKRREGKQLEILVAERTRELEAQTSMLKTAEEEAKSASRAKSEFLAAMSHEIRTPLNAIIGLTDLTLENSGLDKESSANLEKISNAGMILLGTVNDILDISKVEAGKFELIPVVYDIPSLINDTITQSIMHRGEKPIRFTLKIDESLPAQLCGDELRVKQVLNNLLSNAFKYTKEGAVELEISCAGDRDTVWMTACVRDTGIGISPENISRIFDDYAQMNMQANRKIMGTGLGLSIVRRMLELMGGSVSVQSEPGKGSAFTAVIPQKYVGDAAIGPETANNLSKFQYNEQKRRQNSRLARVQLPNAHVLIVDDVAFNLDVAKGLMKPYGMKIHCMTSGRQAIDAVRDGKVRYNAIFMDHMMPGMDGIEAARLIREIGGEYAGTVPIIALTANAVSGNEGMFLDNGFQAFISKPIEVARLDAVIRRWVRDRDQGQKQDQELDSARQPDAGTEGGGYPDARRGRERRSGESRRSGFDRRVFGDLYYELNVNKGVAKYGGDKDMYLDILRSFVTNTAAELDKVKEVNRDYLHDYGIIIHGIKGSSRGILAEALGHRAEALERAAEDGDIGFVMENNPAFLAAAEKLIADLENVLGKLEADILKLKKDSPDQETLARLLRACEAYDADEANGVMEELERYEYAEGGDLVRWLRQNVDITAFKKIVEKLSR